MNTMRASYRPVEWEDVDVFHKWLNDEELIANLYNSLPTNRLKIESFIKSEMEQQYPLTFIQSVAGKPIGYLRLHDLSFINRKVELTMAVAEKEYRAQGYGDEMMKWALAYAFDKLNLEQVYAYVYTTNVRSVRLQERNGFVKEGEFRVLKYHLGKPVSGYRMAVFRDEYKR